MTVFSPSLPPASWTSTSTRSLGVALGESAAAAATPLAKTDGTAEPANTGTKPCLRKSRRLNIEVHLHQFSWNSGVANTMKSRPAWSAECAAANASRPSRVVGLTLASTSVSDNCASVWAVIDAWLRWAAALAKLIRLSRVELLIHEDPPGQPATFGGWKRTCPIGAIAAAAAV